MLVAGGPIVTEVTYEGEDQIVVKAEKVLKKSTGVQNLRCFQCQV